jgi:hypothetical protein
MVLLVLSHHQVIYDNLYTGFQGNRVNLGIWIAGFFILNLYFNINTSFPNFYFIPYVCISVILGSRLCFLLVFLNLIIFSYKNYKLNKFMKLMICSLISIFATYYLLSFNSFIHPNADLFRGFNIFHDISNHLKSLFSGNEPISIINTYTTNTNTYTTNTISASPFESKINEFSSDRYNNFQQSIHFLINYDPINLIIGKGFQNFYFIDSNGGTLESHIFYLKIAGESGLILSALYLYSTFSNFVSAKSDIYSLLCITSLFITAISIPNSYYLGLNYVLPYWVVFFMSTRSNCCSHPQ